MNKIKILEVGPRDGFQNLKQMLTTEQKLSVIDGLVNAGLKSIEITSFVSPKAIPQMADAQVVAEECLRRYPEVELWGLVPNLRGATNAWNAGIRNISCILSVSETHNRANIRRSREETLAEISRIREEYPEANLCIGLATVFGCPYEGILPMDEIVSFVGRIRSIGVYDINLADTVGLGDPKLVRQTIRCLKEAFPDCRWQVHIHDTRNMGMVNTLAAVESGVDVVQSGLGGLGGCPFAPGASGNTATEDLVFMLERMGYDTGVDFSRLMEVSRYQKSFIDGIYSGHHLNIDPSVVCTGGAV